MKHKHADVIKAWADGVPCQWRPPYSAVWRDVAPASSVNNEYRIKPSSPRDEQTDDNTGICMEVEA